MSRDDRGSVTVLTIGLTMVVLLVLVGLSQAGHLFLEQRTLAADCDGAAVAAVQHLDHDVLYATDRTVIDLGAAREAADEPVTTMELLPDGQGVSLTCTRDVDVPFSGTFGIGPTTLRAHSAARLQPRRN